MQLNLKLATFKSVAESIPVINSTNKDNMES